VANALGCNAGGMGSRPSFGDIFEIHFLEAIVSGTVTLLEFYVTFNVGVITGKKYLVVKRDRYNKHRTKQLHAHSYTAHTLVGG